MVEHGEMAANPADLLPAPKRPQTLPRTLKPDDVAALLDRIPATTPLELRDRALFELAYACGLRAEELVNLDVGSVDFDGEQVRVEGKGGKTRFVPAGEPALAAARRATWSAAGPRSRRPTGDPALFLSKSGRRLSTSDVRRRLRVWARHAATPGSGPSARPPALVRDPSAGGRGGPARDPGAARPRVHLHDPGLHSGRVRAAARGVSAQPSAGVTGEPALETNVKALELKDLWRRYKDEASEPAREQLVVAYSPLVKYVAGRMSSGLPAHVEEADLISYGLIGLINAIERFDLEREIKFETYAITRIKGAIIDELRALDWVPRSVRARAREIERVHAKLEHRLHRDADRRGDGARARASRPRSSRRRWSRSPTRPSSRSTSCGRSRTPPATRSRCWTRCRTPTRPTRSSCSTPPSSRTAWPTRSRALPEREKLVIALYYYENLTLREIGEVLGVTESRISQLHTKAVLRLKSRLQGDNLRD